MSQCNESRRQFLRGALAVSAAMGLSACGATRWSLSEGDAPYHYQLAAAPADFTVLPGTVTSGLGFNGGFPAPVIRAKRGVPVRITFTNNLSEPTTIHWHGIRIRNDMDGVPHLTQKPIEPGETFVYEFVCPDAGTFWYHPHMNSLKQLGEGLVGTLIVEEDQPVDFDAEVILQMRDWRLAKDGTFLPLSIPRNAFRMGTLGNVRTVNGQIKPVIDIPAGALVRARLLNIDNTRVYHAALSRKGERNAYPAKVIAIDGNPIAETYALKVHDMGAGMRLDLAFVAPAQVGDELVLFDQVKRSRREICRFRVVGNTAPVDRDLAQVPPLPANPMPVLDLENAQALQFNFEWQGALSPVGKDGKVQSDFWTINRRSWEGMEHQITASGEHEMSMPAPLAELSLGKTYVVEMYNATPHAHPIHMHGVTFKILASNKRKVIPWYSDTVLMEKYERVRIAFVADNPGRWMFHCHVIEHMKTGFMGYFTIR